MFELSKYLKTCNEVYHTTFDPKGPGCVRVHLIPPKVVRMGVPWVVILNGYSVMPLGTSWAIVLKEFIAAVNDTKGVELSDKDIEDLMDKTVLAVKKVFKKTNKNHIKNDLAEMISILTDVAHGNEPKQDIGYLTLAKYAPHMHAPHRMDLLVSSMEGIRGWNCNQKCIHCYAANEKLASVEELTTSQWKKIIDKLKDNYIPSITFTGGEPTLRKDLVEIVEYSKWFVTRLNTNGILLTKELCDSLYQASLDSVQVTFYSMNPAIHNLLVGGNHYDATLEGIKNAIAAGLDVSINTPLCTLNKDYPETIKFLIKLGVHYFSCSGLIPSGNATESEKTTKLSNAELEEVVDKAYQICKQNNAELSFTSPGWLKRSFLEERRMVVPSCGACLSNMAIAPDGTLLPCQSWLFEDGIGNVLKSSWSSLWDSEKCKQIRRNSVERLDRCQLREVRK